MNPFGIAPARVLDFAAFAEYNAGTRSAVLANRDREKREAELDKLEAIRWIA